MTALAPSFLLASARSPPSPPCAPLGPVRQLGCYWGASPEGARLLLGEEEGGPEARGWEAGKAGCVPAVPEVSRVSGSESLHPCPCPIPHPEKNKGEESACAWGGGKGSATAGGMLLTEGIPLRQRPQQRVGMSHPAVPGVAAGEGKEPGCRDGGGQVKTAPTPRCSVNICPCPQAVSIFAPSHTLADSEEGSKGGQVRRSQPGGCGGFERGRGGGGASKPAVAILPIGLSVSLARSLSRPSVPAAGIARRGGPFPPAGRRARFPGTDTGNDALLPARSAATCPGCVRLSWTSSFCKTASRDFQFFVWPLCKTYLQGKGKRQIS